MQELNLYKNRYMLFKFIYIANYLPISIYVQGGSNKTVKHMKSSITHANQRKR